MSERRTDDDPADPADPAGPTIVTAGELDSESLYDSLLRRVAAGSSGAAGGAAANAPAIRVHDEVGPGGKFVLQQEIGSGAMGRVYRALDRYLLRDVAIKFIFRPEDMSQNDFMALFWQEAHIIARLDQHDNIVRIFDVDHSGYPPFIVMEYLDGQSLERLLRVAPIDIPTILHIMIAVACGLGEAHAKGIYHRDLKPSNIFVQKAGRVKLLDFGLARLRNHLFEISANRAHFVTAHAVPPLASAGTPAYMAPEQWRGENAVDAATDLWAMGAIMYRLLAKAPPFDADSLAALSARVLSGEPPPPLAGRCADAPPEVCDLVERMLRFEPTARPGNVSKVIAILEAALHRISSEAQHAQLGLAATSLAGRDDHVAQLGDGSGVGQALRNWNKMALVVVGGVDSAARISAEHLPDWILHQAGVSCEVMHCLAIAAGDLGESAIRLRGFLNTRIKRLRHIFFLTHGDGTAAVLRMLLDEVRRLQGNGSGGAHTDEASQLDAQSPFYRTRHVAILQPGRGVATAHHVGALHAGPDTPPLVAELLAETRGFVDAALPTPSIHYIGIGNGGQALQAGSPAVKALTAILTGPEMMLTRETIAQTFELDRAARITSLVGPAGDATGDDDIASAELLATVPGADAATQAEVFDELVALARTQHQRPMVIVIAGDAGVGKSTVLRMAARHLSGEFLTNGGAVLPIQIPLYFASLTPEQLSVLDRDASDDRRGSVLHDLLLGWWCDWFNDITFKGAIGIDWLRARLRSEPVMVIFDGIDEFLTNHPGLGISDFQQVLTFLRTEYRRNGWLTIVCGVRSTQPGLALLGPASIREVLRLTSAQAMRQFPQASNWISAGSDAPFQKLLYTPLILAQLNARRRPSTLRPTTSGEVILLALTTIIEQSDLCGRLDERGQPIDAERWIDALMAAAWCLFRRLRGEIATSTLRSDGAELYQSWRDHLENTRQQAEGERLLSGFHLLCESRAFHALLHRTILYPTGRGEVRFIHREWQDFLAARYLAQVVIYRHVDEFRHVGNTARISQMAGELLCHAGVRIDEALVAALLGHAQDTGARLITANFSALLTNSRVLLEGPAIDSFLSAINSAPPIARYITLSGLGYRALRDDDASTHDLRHRLGRVFQDHRSVPAADDDELGVMRSLAWCYRKAYAQRFGGPAVGDPWPGLDDRAERAALALMCASNEDGTHVLAEHRSVQLAILEVQQAVAGDRFRPISGVHYLYCLVVAWRRGGGIAELSRELPELLAPGSRYALAIENDGLVPELREILALCRRLEHGV
jgi:tRNA A-37 threonylcarbamoyl transferase component Bud32